MKTRGPLTTCVGIDNMDGVDNMVGADNTVVFTTLSGVYNKGVIDMIR